MHLSRISVLIITELMELLLLSFKCHKNPFESAYFTHTRGLSKQQLPAHTSPIVPKIDQRVPQLINQILL